jgi:ribose transport system permease protein
MTAVEDRHPSSDQAPTRRNPTVSATPTAKLRKFTALDRLSGLYALAALIVLFGLWIPDTFLTAVTARTVSANQSVTAIAAMALIVPLAAGLYDLSVAGTVGVSTVLTIQQQADGRSVLTTLVIVLITGVGIGVVNGVLVVLIGIDSFIATLGTSSLLAAMAYWIAKGNQVLLPATSHFTKYGQGAILGIPDPVWYAAGVAAVLFYVTEYSTVGRYLYAIGGNREAARLIGVRIGRVSFGALITSSILATIAGIVLAAQIGAADPTVGPPYLLPAFSAVLLGATQIKRNGRVNVIGTIIAVALLATGIFGLQLAGAPSYVSDLFNGAALIIAVSLALLANRRAR